MPILHHAHREPSSCGDCHEGSPSPRVERLQLATLAVIVPGLILVVAGSVLPAIWHHAPWSCAPAAAFCVTGVAGILALDCWGIGHQADRDRMVALGAGVCLTGLTGAAGWPEAAGLSGSALAAATALGITVAGGLAVALTSTRRAAMRRPSGRIAVQVCLRTAFQRERSTGCVDRARAVTGKAPGCPVVHGGEEWSALAGTAGREGLAN